MRATSIAGLLLSVGLLASCGSDEPPEQTREQAPTLSGVATYDEQVAAGDVNGKGATGPLRTAVNSSGTNQYSISLAQLTAPYALRWTGSDSSDQQVQLYTFATQAGTANITPLTTLLIAQLLGQNPESAYAAFGTNGGLRMEMITDSNLQAAQAKLTAYLQDVMGVQVRSGPASFITSPFKAVPGDPMFDTLLALDAKLAETGSSFTALTSRVATLARLCIEEKVDITLSGSSREFCPAAKAANPQTDDPSILDYTFTDATGNTLTLQIRGDSVLAIQYGSDLSCTGAACGVVSLGAPANDLTRTIAFNGVQLTGANGTAVLTGTLLGPIPGIALPILPCDDNRFYVILPDRNVVADCVDTADPLGLGGTMNISVGAQPSRAQYRFINSATADPTLPQVEVVTDANDSLLSVYFFQYDPATFIPNVEFVCERAACNGVTLGPVTVNNDFGPPVLIRNITFDNTVLADLNGDGSATFKASFTTVYFVDPSTPALFPELADCTPGSDTIAMDVLSGPFNHCVAPGNRFVTDLGDGGLSYSLIEDAGYPIEVVERNGVVESVSHSSPVSQTFRCSGNCAGVSLSAPDTSGNRTLSFTDTVLHEVQTFPLPGERTVILNSAAIALPP